MSWRKMERRGDKVGKGRGDGIGELEREIRRWIE